jgi:hypothetical protein
MIIYTIALHRNIYKNLSPYFPSPSLKTRV